MFFHLAIYLGQSLYISTFHHAPIKVFVEISTSVSVLNISLLNYRTVFCSHSASISVHPSSILLPPTSPPLSYCHFLLSRCLRTCLTLYTQAFRIGLSHLYFDTSFRGICLLTYSSQHLSSHSASIVHLSSLSLSLYQSISLCLITADNIPPLF